MPKYYCGKIENKTLLLWFCFAYFVCINTIIFLSFIIEYCDIFLTHDSCKFNHTIYLKKIFFYANTNMKHLLEKHIMQERITFWTCEIIMLVNNKDMLVKTWTRIDLYIFIEISQDKAQSIIDEITRAYDNASAGKALRKYILNSWTNIIFWNLSTTSSVRRLSSAALWHAM
jgi:hypothetical protein